MYGEAVNCKDLADMEKNRNILTLLVTVVLFAMPFGMYGHGSAERFLVRREANKKMVFVVDGFQADRNSLDSLDFGNRQCRVLYNGCGKLYLVSRDDDWNYSLDSMATGIQDHCAQSKLGNLKFSEFLRHKAKKDHRSLMSRLELGATELKCNESHCLLYHLGLRLFKGLEEKGEVIYPRGNFIGGKWSFDFFHGKYLVLIGRYNEINIGFESHIYFFDLEAKALFWSHKLQNKKQFMDIKVVGDDVYLVFRKVSPEGNSIPLHPSRCVVATIGSVGMVPKVTFKMVEGFDGRILEIL